MKIQKGNRIFVISEAAKKWTIKEIGGIISVEFNVDKELCQTEDDLREYVMNNDLF